MPTDPRGPVCFCGEYVADHGAGSNHSPVVMLGEDDEPGPGALDGGALDRVLDADPGGWDAFAGLDGDD
jgi:hypothetical protein